MKFLSDIAVFQITFGIMAIVVIVYLLFLLGDAKMKLKKNLEYLKMIDALLIINDFLNSDDVLYKLRLYASKIEFITDDTEPDKVLKNCYRVTISTQESDLPSREYVITNDEVESDYTVDKWCSRIWCDYKDKIQKLS